MSEQDASFGPDMDDRIPGEVIVHLTPEAERGVSQPIPPLPARRATYLPTRFGLPAIDAVLSRLGCQSIVRSLFLAPSQSDGSEMVAAVPEPTYRVRFNDAQIDLQTTVQEIAQTGEVSAVYPNRLQWGAFTPNDPQFGVQWALPHIGCPEAWNLTTGSSSVRVAVLDTGIDLTHPDLQGRLLPGWDFVDLPLAILDAISGWMTAGDYLTMDNDPQDDHGHGTQVAGIIAANINNDVDIAGVAGGCQLFPVRVMSHQRNIHTNETRIIGGAWEITQGIFWAALRRAAIINISGGGYTDLPAQRDAIEFAAGLGCLVVAAMGNDNTNRPFYPAAYEHRAVLAVGATTNANSRWAPNAASGSNIGPHISLVAPGLTVLSTRLGGGFENMNGTSAATALVSGVAALVKSCSPGLSAASIAALLKANATRLRDHPSDPVPNDRYGMGLVNAFKSIIAACPIPFDPRPIPFDPGVDVTVRTSFRDDVVPSGHFSDPIPPRWPWPVTPFILATPHHAPIGPDPAIASAYEARMVEYETMLAQMEAALQRGGATQAEWERYRSLCMAYRALISEYRRLRS